MAVRIENRRIVDYSIQNGDKRYFIGYGGGKYVGGYMILLFNPRSCVLVSRAVWEKCGCYTPVFPSFTQAVAFLKTHVNELREV